MYCTVSMQLQVLDVDAEWQDATVVNLMKGNHRAQTENIANKMLGLKLWPSICSLHTYTICVMLHLSCLSLKRFSDLANLPVDPLRGCDLPLSLSQSACVCVSWPGLFLSLNAPLVHVIKRLQRVNPHTHSHT